MNIWTLNILISLFLSQHTFAKDATPLVSSTDPDVSKSMITDTVELIKKVNIFIDGAITPTNDKINIAYQSSSANYNGLEVNVPYNYNSDGQIKSFKNTRAIIIHEYGHAIFSKNMAEKSKDWKILREKQRLSIELKPHVEEFSNKSLEKLLKLAALKKSGQLDEARELEQQFRAEEEKHNNEILEPFSKATDWVSNSKLYKISKKYNELFSDLLAVLILGDPKSIYKSLQNQTFNYDLNDFEFISYSGSDPFTFRDFSSKQNMTSPWVESEEHIFLSPVRHFIWKNYLKSGDLKHKKSKLLKLVFEACSEEILILYMNNYSFTPEEVNQSLISRIQKKYTEL